MIDTDHLIGREGIASLADVSYTAVSNWATRFADFPEAVVKLKRGSAWDRREVLVWLQAHGKIGFGTGMRLRKEWGIDS